VIKKVKVNEKKGPQGLCHEVGPSGVTCGLGGCMKERCVHFDRQNTGICRGLSNN